MFGCWLKAPFLNRRNRIRSKKRIVSFLDFEVACVARLIDHKADDREAGLSQSQSRNRVNGGGTADELRWNIVCRRRTNRLHTARRKGSAWFRGHPRLFARRLQRILVDFEPAPTSLNLLFQPSRLASAKARAFVDYLVERWRIADPFSAQASPAQ